MLTLDQLTNAAATIKQPNMSNFTFHNSDCMEIMRNTPDKFYDLAIVDPPYGIGADIKNNGPNSKSHEKNSKAKIKTYKKTNWDSKIPTPEYFNELYRISNRQIIWGANYFGLIGGMIYWHKDVIMPTYSTGELAWVSWMNKIDFIKITWNGMLQQNMKNKEERIHQTQKPVALYEYILKKYVQPNQKILDTHLGSGSIAIAVEKANRYDNMNLHLTACEIDKDYFDAAMKRFDNFLKEPTFDFDKPTPEPTQTNLFE